MDTLAPIGKCWGPAEGWRGTAGALPLGSVLWARPSLDASTLPRSCPCLPRALGQAQCGRLPSDRSGDPSNHNPTQPTRALAYAPGTPQPGALYSLAAAGSGDWGRGVLGENAVAAGMARAILLPYL